MIYAITPNPTLDLGGSVDELIPNEKNYVYDETKSPGGNAINAARIMNRLGAPVIATGFLGGGVGHMVEELLKGEGLSTRFIDIGGATRLSVTVSNRKTDLQTRLSFSGPKISSNETQMLFDEVMKAKKLEMAVIGGSLPPGVSARYIIRLIRALSDRQVPTLVDVPGAILAQVVSAKPMFIKPNLLEFQELVGKKVSSIANVLREARKLSHKVPLICVSSVEGGALLITQDNAWFGRTPKLKVRTTVGAGDSMVGAIATHLLECFRRRSSERSDEPLPDDKVGELLRWGLASAAATLETCGTELGKAREIRAHLKMIQVKEVT